MNITKRFELLLSFLTPEAIAEIEDVLERENNRILLEMLQKEKPVKKVKPDNIYILKKATSLNGTDRYYPKLIGKQCWFYDLKTERPMIIDFIGDDIPYNSSTVKQIERFDDGKIIVTTSNTVYYFELWKTPDNLLIWTDEALALFKEGK